MNPSRVPVFLPIVLLVSVLFPWAAWSQQGEVVDRMVAVVNGRIITQSDLKEAVRWVSGKQDKSGQGIESPGGEILRSYLERLLVRQEIENYPGLEVSEEEMGIQWQRVSALHPEILTNLPEKDRQEIKAELRDQLLYEKYIDLRFRPFVEIQSAETDRYYRDVFSQEWKKASDREVPALSEVQEKIRPILVEGKIHEQLDRWIEELRQKAEIQIFPENVQFLPQAKERRYPYQANK